MVSNATYLLNATRRRYNAEVGGETEFMLAEPRPLMVRPKEGVAVVWSNCVLEERRASGAWEPGYDRCLAGAGPHGWGGAS